MPLPGWLFDPAILGGVATFPGRTVMFIGQQKGHDTQREKIKEFQQIYTKRAGIEETISQGSTFNF